MDEPTLKQNYGLGDCRLCLVKRLRSTCFSVYTIISIIAYAILLTVSFLVHDYWYEERALEYLNSTEDSGSNANVMQFALFVTELVILAAFAIDLLLNIISYGLLYLKRVPPILEALLILMNTGAVVRMLTDSNDSKSLFGAKMLTGVVLLIFRVEVLKEKIIKLGKLDIKKIHPEGHLTSLNESAAANKNQLGVVSVREKVIEELRNVQDRVDHDAQADVALEYCIKMIVTNQLNEQDLNFLQMRDDLDASENELPNSYSEVSSSRHEIN